jgi:Ni/Fe-hydrogenase 1 B-type cytochrome subunit
MKPSTGTTSSVLSFQEKHSVPLRLWHWISSFTIIALLITVLIASTLLKPRNNIKHIQDKLEEKGLVVNTDQAKAVAKTLSKEIWIWHKYLGIGLAVMLLFRIIMEFFEPSGQSLRARIRSGALYLKQVVTEKASGRHYLFVKYFYVFFYLCTTVMVLTGLCMIYDDDFEFLQNIKETIKDIHSFTMYLIMGFIILHIGGILRMELRDRSGIVSGMIHGGGEE